MLKKNIDLLIAVERESQSDAKDKELHFQQDFAPPDWYRPVRLRLNQKYRNRRISKIGAIDYRIIK